MDKKIQRIKDKINEYGMAINAPIPLCLIREFERIHDIRLPEELLRFYTEIANGCENCLKRFEELEIDVSKWKEEFVFTDYWIWEDDYDEELFEKVDRGNIELINLGDGMSWNLIVTGKERGQMWFFSDVGIQPCNPKRSFLSWFQGFIEDVDFFEGV